MNRTTGRHSATTVIPANAAELIEQARAAKAYPILLVGKRHQPGARAHLTEAAREYRAHLDTQHALGTLAVSA